MAYLLDTNAVSSLVRDPEGPMTRRIAVVGDENVCTSVIVAAEIRYGGLRRNSEPLARQVEVVLGGMPVLPFEQPADEVYGRIRNELERAGTPIGQMDLLIAAQALVQGHVLVTDNEREFRRVDGLQVENWLRP